MIELDQSQCAIFKHLLCSSSNQVQDNFMKTWLRKPDCLLSLINAQRKKKFLIKENECLKPYCFFFCYKFRSSRNMFCSTMTTSVCFAPNATYMIIDLNLLVILSFQWIEYFLIKIKQKASPTLTFSLYIFTCDLDFFFSVCVRACVWG